MEKDKLWALRHSAEHILTQAMERLWPGQIVKAMGPAIDDGFYFDFDTTNGLKVTEADFPKIEKEMNKIVQLNLPFEKMIVTAEKAKEMFKDNPYKQEWIEKAEKEGEEISLYWTGDPGKGGSFVDVCAGPHVVKTIEVKAFKLLSVAGAYWHGDEKNKMLTRIYGTAFESQEELDKYVTQIEEAKKRDHKKLGPQLGIFFFDETAPGMPYWLPKGTIIINELLKFWREEHLKRGYLETITPQLNKKKLYETSGHWDHYKDFMFICDMGEDETYCLKPMNCPNAMTIFKQGIHSYRDLPLRFSDCDALHRHEKSGELNGLLRVQKFAQDDAHIFVTEDQIADEYKRILEIAKLFYSIFGIKFKIRLGTRPDDFMGDIETWDKAEKELEQILIDNKFDYFIGQGEGAFYGPKLDILMDDCLGRQWQTGTIQLDFQLPRNFDLKYIDSKGEEQTPVVIHRVIYGSLERFIGILIEQFAGAFPTWISPVQVAVLPISEKTMEYSQKVTDELKKQGIRVELNTAADSLGKKIRNAEAEKVPYMLIIGEKEAEAKLVSVRQRGQKDLGTMNVADFADKIIKEIEEKSL